MKVFTEIPTIFDISITLACVLDFLEQAGKINFRTRELHTIEDFLSNVI